VCYLTDGYVGNDMQIIQFVGEQRGDARMFPIGIGNSVNRFLIEGMAREGMGAPDYVLLNESGAEHAARFYQRIASPLLLDVEVDFGDLPVEEVYPQHIPDVFSAKPVIVKGRYTHAGQGFVTVRGFLRGRPWQRTIAVRFPEADPDGSALASVWAREKIQDLQSQDWIGAQTGNPKREIKDAIIRTALEYRLMSQHTSFVAVEQQVVNVGGQQRTVDVPVEMPEGVSYEGIFGPAYDASATPAAGALLRAASPSRPRMTDRMTAMAEESVDLTLGPDTEARSRSAGGRLGTAKQDLRRLKLSSSLLKKIARGGAEQVTVQIWLADLPSDGMKRLREAGFRLTTELRPGKLILGTIPLKRLDALIALDFIRAVEEPRVR